MYIDETGNADLRASADPRHQYLSLTGLIVDLDYVATQVAAQVEALKWKHFRSHPDNPPLILHRKEVMNKLGPFQVLADPGRCAAFDGDVLKLLEDLAFIVVTVVIDKQDHLAKYKVWHYEPYHYCMRVLVERYVMFLSGAWSTGDVMAEARGAREDRALKASYSRIYAQGTEFQSKTAVQRRLTSKELKLSPKAANVPVLQPADLVAHPSWRATVQRHHGQELDANFGGRLAALLEEQNYRRSRKGEIWGYGRIWLP